MAGVACRGLVCVCVRLEKWQKIIGMTIRKSIVSFLPCLVAFFFPICSFIFLIQQLNMQLKISLAREIILTGGTITMCLTPGDWCDCKR